MLRIKSLFAALLLFATPALATQNTYVMPLTGPHTMAEVMTILNAGLLSMNQCNSGATAPANGPGAAATTFQCWMDTTGNPVVLKLWDGASWVAAAKLDTTAHTWTPVFAGNDLGSSGARAGLGLAIGTNVEAWDADLDCLAAISTTGLVARTGAGTCAVRTITQPAEGITVTNGGGVAGNPTIALANDLAAIEALASTGFAARTGTDTWAQRTLTAPGAGMTITNPAGIAGNPTFAFADDLAAVEALATTGIVRRTGTATWTAGTAVANSEFATQAAWTFKLNNTSGAATPTDVDIPTLTTKGSPGAGDFVILSDQAASGALKKATVSSLGGGGNVSGTGTSTVDDLATFNNTSANGISSPGYNAQQIPGLIPTTSTVTITNASPGVISWTAHALKVGATVFFCTTGALPTGLTACVPSVATQVSPNSYKSNPTLYYVCSGATLLTNSFAVATSMANAKAGTCVNTSSAGSGTHTAFANAMACAGCVGEYIYNLIEIANAVSATTGSGGQAWNTLSLTAGIWEIGGRTGVIGVTGTAAFTHMHATINAGIAPLFSSSPYNGATAAHINSNQSNGWIFPHDPETIFLTTTTTISATATTDFTGGTAGFYGKLWAKRTK